MGRSSFEKQHSSISSFIQFEDHSVVLETRWYPPSTEGTYWFTGNMSKTITGIIVADGAVRLELYDHQVPKPA